MLRELLELTNRLSEPLQSEEVARVIVDQARAAMGAVTAILWSIEDPPTHAGLVRASGLEPGVLVELYARIPIEPWLPMGDAILRLEPLFFESRSDFRARYETAERMVTGEAPFGELSHACLPLVVHGRAIAGVSLVFPGARTFESNERMFLAVFAHHAAQALERAALFEREKQARRRLEGMQRFTAALSSAATVEDVAVLATRVGVEALELATGALWVTDEPNLRLLSGYGWTDEERAQFEYIPLDSSLPAARVVRDRCSVWCENERDAASEHPSIVAVVGRGAAFRAFGALLLARGDRALGVLVFARHGQHRFSPEERAFMTAIADHCADALARARLHDDARSATQLLQSVIERLPVGILVSRPPDSTLVLSNDALQRMWRTDGFPLLGADRCKVMNASYPDGRPIPLAESPMARALRGEIVEALDARIERSDGTTGWVQVSAAPVLREDGGVDVAVAAFVDTTAVEEARAAADEAGRIKDEFLAMLGHELRNPLTPITTALAIMELQETETFRAERTLISRQVRHMSRLVDDLLDISRITRGEVLLRKERIEVAKPIATAIETASPLFEQRSQTLTMSVPMRGLPVVVDPARLSQAVANLLTNAAKYTEPNGRISIVAEREDGEVCIRVSDTGIGIEPEVLPKVFELFVQARRSIDRAQGGLGIGLTIVRHLVELSGGTVSAHSAGIGRGSEFAIRLPLDRADTPVTGEPPRTVQPTIPRCRVLVVDDNADIATSLASLLRALGCVTHVAYDGPSALLALASFRADLAMLDIGLPVMDGYELARHLRGAPATARMRLVAVTGYGQATDRQRCLDAGFDEHIVKPVELASVRDVLSRVVVRVENP